MQLKGIWKLMLWAPLVLSFTVNAAPMDDVFTLLENGGGVKSDKNSEVGYYVTALGFSDRSSEAKAYEEARIEALRYLNEMINGVSISGSTYSSTSYITESDGNSSSEYSQDEFQDVARVTFKGQLAATKTLKKGKYDGQYFVAISISQNDIQQIRSLKSDNLQSGATTMVIMQGSGNGNSVANFDRQEKSVESKGLSSMKNGEQRARELALQDAMRNAVQQVQGVMLQGKSGAFNETLSFALSTKTEGYVGGYEIIDEDISRGSYYVIIMAKVNAGKLLSDVNFYLDVLGTPVFSIESRNDEDTEWLSTELERLGFAINDGTTKPTHTFYLKQSQKQVTNHNGKTGIETSISVQLKDNSTGEVLFTVINSPLKTRIYVSPLERAEQVSQVAAYKRLKKKMGAEVIQSLAKYAEKGRLYTIEIRNARKTDWKLFKHTLNNGTAGSVEGWDWSKDGKVMILSYRYSGTLSAAMDEGLDQLYTAYKKEGKGRRPTAVKISERKAVFEIIKR